MSVAAASRLQLGRRMPPLRAAYFAIRPRLQPNAYRIDGLWLHAHKDDNSLTHALVSSGRFEPSVSACLDRALRPGDILLDVGANIGYHTLRGAIAVRPWGRVVAVEPEADNLRILRENVATNQLNNVTVLPIAAGSSPGVFGLYTSASNRGDHRLYALEGRPRQEVPVERLDDALAELGFEPDVIKIDVQGWELEVVRGLERTVERDRCVLVTELWSEGLAGAGAEPQEYIDLLRTHGFELFELADGKPKPLDNAFDLRGCDTNLLGLKGLDGDDRRALLQPY
jgi:FkbM family methyltransferase